MWTLKLLKNTLKQNYFTFLLQAVLLTSARAASLSSTTSCRALVVAVGVCIAYSAQRNSIFPAQLIKTMVTAGTTIPMCAGNSSQQTRMCVYTHFIVE